MKASPLPPHPQPTLPPLVRARLDFEVAADLEGAYRTLLERGMPPERALARARELIVPGKAALEGLTRVHRPLYALLVARFSAVSTRRGERLALLVVGLSALAGLVRGVNQWDLASNAAPFLTPVLVVGATLVASLVATSFFFFVKQDDARRVRSSLAWSLGLTLGLVLVAGLGTLGEIYRFAATVEHAAPPSFSPLVTVVGATATTLSLALGLALFGALGWFLLLHAVVHAEASAVSARAALHTRLDSSPMHPNL